MTDQQPLHQHATAAAAHPAPLVHGFRYIGEVLLIGIVGASPWLFACTDQWAKEWMFALIGGLSLVCFCDARINRSQASITSPIRRRVKALAWVNIAFLVYLTIMFLNPRADLIGVNKQVEYFEHYFTWLPTTYHREGTLWALMELAALTGLFWSVRHLLLWNTRNLPGQSSTGVAQRLIWFLIINGGALSIFALLQRASGTDKIYWIYPTRWGHEESIFGPFPYRGNAADFFNLLWPVAFGFAYALWRARKSERNTLYTLPLLCGALSCIAPIASTSRGGAMTTILLGVIAAIYMMRRMTRRLPVIIALVFVVGVSAFVSGPKLLKRFQEIDSTMSGRDTIYKHAVQIIKDYPLFGVGAGAFGTVYRVYREDDERWESYAHNDWLEAAATTGIVGAAIQLTLLGLVCSLAFYYFKQGDAFTLRAAIALALFGCGFHALFDFPFRIFAIQVLFTTLCALLTAPLSPQVRPGKRNPAKAERHSISPLA